MTERLQIAAELIEKLDAKLAASFRSHPFLRHQIVDTLSGQLNSSSLAPIADFIAMQLHEAIAESEQMN